MYQLATVDVQVCCRFHTSNIIDFNDMQLILQKEFTPSKLKIRSVQSCDEIQYAASTKKTCTLGHGAAQVMTRMWISLQSPISFFFSN